MATDRGRVESSDRANNRNTQGLLRPPAELPVGHYGSRTVYQTMPQYQFQTLTKAEQDIVRQADRIARREQRKARRSQQNSPRPGAEPVTGSQASQHAGVVSTSDPYAVVIELAQLTVGMDATANPRQALLVTETISRLLKQIDDQERRRAEQKRDEQELDNREQQLYRQRLAREEQRLRHHLETIAQDKERERKL